MCAFISFQRDRIGFYEKKTSKKISFALAALSFGVIVLYQTFMTNATRRNIARVLLKDERVVNDDKNILRFLYYNVDRHNPDEKLPLPIDHYQ